MKLWIGSSGSMALVGSAGSGTSSVWQVFLVRSHAKLARLGGRVGDPVTGSGTRRETPSKVCSRPSQCPVSWITVSPRL